jgi:hypothetical protein
LFLIFFICIQISARLASCLAPPKVDTWFAVFHHSIQPDLPSLELPPDASTTGLRSTSSPDPPSARTFFQPRWSHIDRRNSFHTDVARGPSAILDNLVASSLFFKIFTLQDHHEASSFHFLDL